jgi:UDP-glucose 4-epimerase
MRVLVTGGGGFIGSHVTERLLHDGHDVRVLDNFSSGRRENLLRLADDFELVEGDVQSYERAHTAVRGCDAVIHQAALPSVPRSIQDPLTSNASNVIGTLNVLLAARDSGVGRVVYASSSSVYGTTDALPMSEELPTAPISPYAVAKLAGEGYCRSFWVVYGLETVALRYFNVFGPRQDPRSQYAGVVAAFVDAFVTDQRPAIYGDGEQTRDFTPVENVVEATLLALDTEAIGGEVFNIACGQETSLNRLIAELQTLTGSFLEPAYLEPRVGEIRRSRADVSRARRRLGYRPSVALDEGLRRTIDHARNQAAERAAAVARRDY